MSNFYVGEVLFETGGTIETAGDINVTAICDCTGSTGTAGQLLSSTGVALEWITGGSGGSGIPCSILTAKGDIVTASASGTPAALPVGTFGQVLLADSGCATGLKWGSVPTASVTGLGVMYGCVTSSAPNNTSVGYFTLPYGSPTCTIAVGNNSMIGAQGDSHIAIGVSIRATGSGTGCNIAIGNGIGGGDFQDSSDNVIIGQYAGCVCVSASSRNVIIGSKAAQNLSTACNNVAIGYGVAPPTSTSDCTLAIGYDTGCHWLTGTSTKAIKPGAGIIDCAGSCGTVGQVLCSNGANAIQWATPQTSPFITYDTAPTSYTSGTPLLVGIWDGGTMQGSVYAPTFANSNLAMWEFYMSGDATNLNTGWYQTGAWPANPGDGGYLGSWYVDFPVYPDPNANKWMIYFNPAQNSLNPTVFTFFYRLVPGSNPPVWQI